MTDQELEARFKAFEEHFETRLQNLEDRLVKFMAQEFQAVRQELDNTRQELRQELGAVERRVSFLGEMTAALVRHDGTAGAEVGQIRGAQAGQQRAIEDLDRRLRRLEEKNGQKP